VKLVCFQEWIRPILGIADFGCVSFEGVVEVGPGGVVPYATGQRTRAEGADVVNIGDNHLHNILWETLVFSLGSTSPVRLLVCWGSCLEDPMEEGFNMVGHFGCSL
jgi:hypothetical protein